MEAAREKLVEDNIKLVPHIYHKNKRYFLDYSQYQDDFLSAGNLGLVKAANTFDFEKGTKFTSYSGLCILNEMLMLRRKLAKQFGNEINESGTIISDKDDKEISLMELTPGEDIFQKVEDTKDYNDFYEKVAYIFITKFTDNQRKVFSSFLDGIKQKEALEILGISQTYYSHIKQRTFEIIKENMDMRITSTPYAPHKSDYDNFSEYSRDYQRYHYLKSQGRESEFIPAYGNNKGKAPVKILEEQKINITPQEIPTNTDNQNISGFEEVISLLDNLEKEYISKIKKIRLAKQSLTSVMEMNK